MEFFFYIAGKWAKCVLWLLEVFVLFRLSAGRFSSEFLTIHACMHACQRITSISQSRGHFMVWCDLSWKSGLESTETFGEQLMNPCHCTSVARQEAPPLRTSVWNQLQKFLKFYTKQKYTPILLLNRSGLLRKEDCFDSWLGFSNTFATEPLWWHLWFTSPAGGIYTKCHRFWKIGQWPCIDAGPTAA